MSVEYANSGITGKLGTNDNGEIVSFKADCKIYEDSNGNKWAIAPRKNLPGFVNSYKKANGLATLSEDEIQKNCYKIQNPMIPTIEYIEIQEECINDFLLSILPAILKIAYEYAYTRLREEYLNDDIAISIRYFVNKYMDGVRNIDNPTDVQIAYDKNEFKRKLSLAFEVDKNNLYTDMYLFGFLKAKILVSEVYDNYKESYLTPIVCE